MVEASPEDVGVRELSPQSVTWWPLTPAPFATYCRQQELIPGSLACKGSFCPSPAAAHGRAGPEPLPDNTQELTLLAEGDGDPGVSVW